MFKFYGRFMDFCNKSSTDPPLMKFGKSLLSAVRSKRNDIAQENIKNNYRTARQEDLMIPNECSLYHKKFFTLLILSESMWIGYFLSAKAGKPKINFKKTESVQIHSAPYRKGSKSCDFGEAFNKRNPLSAQCWTLQDQMGLPYFLVPN